MKIFFVSLVLACSIWLIYTLSLSYSGVVSVPVVAVSNLEGHSRESAAPVMVSARCRTTGYSLLRSHSKAKGKAKVIEIDSEVLHFKEGETFVISSSDLTAYSSELFGDQVRLESFISPVVQFRFAAENCIKVPVSPVTSLSFKSQFMPASPMQTVPDSVLLYGDPLVLDGIHDVKTSNIVKSNLYASIHGVTSLDVPTGVRSSVSEVSYSLDVTRYVELSEDMDVKLANVPYNKEVEVFPSAVRVFMKCSFPASKVNFDKMRVVLDYTDLSRSREGQVIPKLENVPIQVLEYRIVPDVLDCIEKAI